MILNDINTTTLNGILQDMYFEGKFTVNTFNKADLLRIVNKTYKILQEDIRAVNEDFFLVVTRTNLNLSSVSNGIYTIPTDNEKIKSIWVAPTPANIAAPLESEFVKVNIIDANAQTNPAYVFSNPTVILRGPDFILYPLYTDATKFPVIKGLKIYYIPTQPDLSNDTDSPNIFADYHDLITWGSLIETSTRLGQEDVFDKATKRFKERRAEMKRDAAQRILDIEPEYIEGQTSAGGWAFSFGRTGI